MPFLCRRVTSTPRRRFLHSATGRSVRPRLLLASQPGARHLVDQGLAVRAPVQDGVVAAEQDPHGHAKPVQLGVARLQRGKILLRLFRELLKDGAPARILRDPRRARVELEPAALGRDGDTQGIAGKHHLSGSAFGLRRLARLTRLARAVDLDHALRDREAPRRRHIVHERLDVGAEELE